MNQSNFPTYLNLSRYHNTKDLFYEIWSKMVLQYKNKYAILHVLCFCMISNKKLQHKKCSKYAVCWAVNATVCVLIWFYVCVAGKEKKVTLLHDYPKKK